MNKVLFTLTPVGRFFFGGNNTFEVIKNGKVQNSESSNYIVFSNYFPQQTTILGMLRFLILSHSNCFDVKKQKIIDVEKAKKLIGENGFSVGNMQGYVRIKSIGTCFIQRKKLYEPCDWESLQIAPYDYPYKLCFENSSDGLFNDMTVTIPNITPYDPKNQEEMCFLTTSGEKVRFSDVFTEDIRIGINKDYSGVSQESAYYKQIAYRFGKKGSEYQFRFAFNAEIEGDTYSYNSKMVSMGGDHSMFVLGVETTVDPCYNIQGKEIKGYDRVVLTSNAFIEKPVVFDFAMAETLPFRFLKTSVDTENYNILSKEVNRSELFELYRAGSVFYFRSKAKRTVFLESIKTHKEFMQIGYNQYQAFYTNKNNT